MAFFGNDNPLRRRFAANTGWLIAQSVFQYVLSAVIGIIAARFLGPANYGILGYGVSLMAIFQAFCTLGFNDIQITNMVETPEDEGGIIGTALALRLVSSTISIGAIALAAWITRPGESLLLLVTVLQSIQLVFQSFDAMRLWFQKELLSKYTAVGSIVGNIACSAWRIVLLIQGAGVEWFALTSVIQMLANYLVVVPLFFAKAKKRLWFSWNVAKRLLSRSWHFILSALTNAAAAHFSRLYLGSALGDQTLGLYNAAYMIATMWLFVPLAIVDSALPVLLQTKRNHPEAFYPRYQLMLMAVLSIGIAAGLGLSLLAPWVVNLLYGEAYASAAGVLRIVAWLGVFSNIGSGRSIWIQAEGRQSAVKYISLITAITSILLSILLIPLLGLTGAAIACVGGFVVSAFVAPLMVRSARPFVGLYFGSFRTLTQYLRSAMKNRKFGA
ncbi:MAG: flippase [Christensenella sp.]|nr:flippase [Christensenella sp.]